MYLSIYVSSNLFIYLYPQIINLCISKRGRELIFIICSLEVQFSTEHLSPPQACPILPIPPLEVSIPPLGRNIPHFENPWAKATDNYVYKTRVHIKNVRSRPGVLKVRNIPPQGRNGDLQGRNGEDWASLGRPGMLGWKLNLQATNDENHFSTSLRFA